MGGICSTHAAVTADATPPNVLADERTHRANTNITVPVSPKSPSYHVRATSPSGKKSPNLRRTSTTDRVNLPPVLRVQTSSKNRRTTASRETKIPELSSSNDMDAPPSESVSASPTVEVKKQHTTTTSSPVLRVKTDVLNDVRRRVSAPVLDGQLKTPENITRRASLRPVGQFGRRPSNRGMMAKFALQFPVIEKSFKAVRKTFKKNSVDDGHTIPAEKLRTALEQCGETRSLSDDEIAALFNQADLDKSRTISFREFLVCIALGHFLRREIDAPQFRMIQRGFKVIQHAFQEMDSDGGGTVDIKELREALSDAPGASMEPTVRKRDAVLEARFKELDIDGDGKVSFPEFVYGLAHWVGMDDDDDDDSDEENTADAHAENAESPPQLHIEETLA